MKWLDAEPMKWWDAERISVSSFIIYTVQYTTVLPLLRVRNFLERSEQFAHCFQAVSGYSQDSLGYCLNSSRPQTGQFQTISWTVSDYFESSSRLFTVQFSIQPGQIQAIHIARTLPGYIARTVPGYCQDSSRLLPGQFQTISRADPG